MKKNAFLTYCILYLSTLCFGQGNYVWQAESFTGPGANNYSHHLIQDSIGNYYYFSFANVGSSSEIYLSKFTEEGLLSFQKTLDFPSYRVGKALLPHNGKIPLHLISVNNSKKHRLAFINFNGDSLSIDYWHNSSDLELFQVVQDSFSNIYSVFSTASATTSSKDLWVQKRNPDGLILWANNLGTYYTISEGTISPANPSGKMCVTATVYHASSDRGFFFRLDSSGQLVNSSATNARDYHSITISPNGYIYTKLDTALNVGHSVARLDTAGQFVWRIIRPFPGVSSHYNRPVSQLLCDTSGNVYSVDYGNPNSNGGIKIIKISPSGSIIWEDSVSEFPVFGGTPMDFGFVSQDRIAVMGSYRNGQIINTEMVVFDLDGNIILRDRFINRSGYPNLNKHISNSYNGKFGTHSYVYDQTQGRKVNTYIQNYCLSCLPNLTGKIYFDANLNCIPDSNEIGIPNQVVLIDSAGQFTITDSLGNYSFYKSPDTHLVAHYRPSWWNPTCPILYHSVTLNDSQPEVRNFGVMPPGYQQDLWVFGADIWHSQGRTFPVYCAYGNRGIVYGSGTLSCEISPSQAISSATVPWDSVSGNTYFWNIDSIPPFSADTMRLQVYSNLGTGGDSIFFDWHFNPIVGDPYPPDNHFRIDNFIRGSFDPNSIEVAPRGMGWEGRIRKEDTLLTYTIRFQNVGTDTAFTVKILDSIPTELNLATFKQIGSSHPCKLDIYPNRKVIWTFDDIILPDSATNETESNGFVRYSIQTRKGLEYGDTILNQARIYFDYNDPVITNIARSKVSVMSETLPGYVDKELDEVVVFPNPANETLNVFNFRGLPPYTTLTLYDLQGKLVWQEVNKKKQPLVTIPVQDLPKGLYLLNILNLGRNETVKVLVE